MTGKKLTKNLAAALVPFFEIPVVAFDANERRDLPCVCVGYETEEQTKPGLLGHFTVGGFVMIAVNGYDDASNEQADALADDAINALADWEALSAAINPPAEGEDERPAQGIFCNRLFVRGTERQQEESSTFIFVRCDAFCRASD